MRISSAVLVILSMTFLPAAARAATVFLGSVRSLESSNDINLDGINDFFLASGHTGVNAYGNADETVRGVTFQTDGQAGSASNPIGGGILPIVQISAPNFIDGYANMPTTTGPDSAALNRMLHDIRWAGSPGPGDHVTSISNLTIGKTYRVQMLTHANAGANYRRIWDIVWDAGDSNAFAVDEFDNGGDLNPSQLSGAIWEYEFLATKTAYDIEFRGNFGGASTGGDRNATLAGVLVTELTLVPEPASGALSAMAVVGGSGAWLRRRRKRTCRGIAK